MKFSTKTTYGLRAIIQLAKNYGNEPMSVAVIAKEENLSPGYLERLFASLKKSKLIKASMGASGGYTLAKKPSAITVYDIVKSLEGKLAPFHCLDEDGKIYCDYKCNCGATTVLIKVQNAVNSTLKSIKLADLL